jgi:uncharacterized membrane protein YfcA
MGEHPASTLLVAGVVAVAAGLIRGLTGFGGALVMSPPFALLLGPLTAVPVVLLLESIAAAPMLVQTGAQVRWPLVGPIIVASCVTAPLGVLLLVNTDPEVMRRAIAATVLLFSLLLARGWRYTGRQRLPTAVGVGAVSGALAGSTGMGGPPVILYLLAGPDPVSVTRANLTFFVAAVAVASLAGLAANGALPWAPVVLAALFAPGYYLGMALGTRLFSRFSDARFRSLTLLLLAGVAFGILLA